MADLEPLPPLPARRLLSGFRDLGTDASHGADAAAKDLLACDPSFNRYTAYWVLGPTLDASYAALEGMRLADAERSASRIAEIKPSVTRFLADHYDSTSGRFSTNASPRTRGVFAFHAAVGVVHSLHALPIGEKVSQPILAEVFSDLGTTLPRARDLLRDMIAQCRDGDGLVENPDKALVPSLTAMYTANLMLWYLSDGDDRMTLTSLIEPRRLQRFCDGCLKRQCVGAQRIAGFSIHPDHEELCVNTTSFGLRLRERLGLGLDAEVRKEIEAFLTLSFRDGGFSSTLWEPRSLNATFLGLKALKLIIDGDGWAAFLTGNGQAIRSFVGTCQRPGTGAAAFSPQWATYRPNALATRYRLQILEMLDEGQTPDHANPSFSFFNEQFDRAIGGFRGYPADAVLHNGFSAKDLEQYLDQKDEILKASHQEQLNRPSRPPSYRPDTTTLKLYDRLAELGQERARHPESEELTEEIDRTWHQLRQREEAEAARYEGRLEEILAPLRRGSARLDELERSLATA